MDTIDDYLSCGPYRVFGYDRDVKTVTILNRSINRGFKLYTILENKLFGTEIRNSGGFMCYLCEKPYNNASFCHECYLIIRDSTIRKLDTIPSIIDIHQYDMSLCKSVIYCLEYSVCKLGMPSLQTLSSGLQADSSGLQTDTYIISHLACKNEYGVVKHIKGIYSVLESNGYLNESSYIRDPIIANVILRKVLRRMMIFREYSLINDIFLVILRQWIALEN
jgi:hypothetical protein